MSGRSAAATAQQPEAQAIRPLLLFFFDPSSGLSRRVEGFLAQVLQRRRNHDTFDVRRIDCEKGAELARRCRVERAPALVVVEAKRVRARIEAPRGCVEIQQALAPWLR